MVMGDTIGYPGGDAAVVRVHGTDKAVAISTDVTPRYCLADPFEGGKQAIAETWRNLTAVGAEPLAVTDCMNFGNPERPKIMGQFAGCIKGMADACKALEYPVVSGNVSLYNETNGVGIPPTPAIGGVGLIKDLTKRMDIAFKNEGDIILLLGDEHGHLGQSVYMDVLLNRTDGAPPPVDLSAERQTGDLVRYLIESEQVTAVHDCSDGGLYVAIAEMALSGNIGADISLYDDLPAHAMLFGEDQGRYVLTVPFDMADNVMKYVENQGVTVRKAGHTQGKVLTVAGEDPISLEQLRAAHESWLPDYMA